ncbi:aspartate/glutamate racemase family protein [Piscinibacter sakaiensis]|uniref:Hydantoin racemase n=1 Tax=Piscinibacter sakaiensis TaxID=1547922 RepID=A0A0K8P8P5_PISS1|nr:aspartate/glutamate racemase family protein [Piscinibacter sakaiensis]GAP39006.1 hydantoin racemase [Piscinibacter sakaiensis]
MPTLLLINPNTSASVTALMAAQARRLLPPGAAVTAVTAEFGAPYLSSEAAVAVAGHATLQAYARHVAAHGAPDAVLIGCFGDPGLLALRELAPMPVTGLAEAAMRAAAARGRYGIVTGGAAWAPMLRRLAWSLGLLEPLGALVTVERSGAELLADPPAAHALLADASRQALADAGPPGLASLVLGGAALSGMEAAIAPGLPVPMLDSVACGLQAAWALACGDAPPPPREPGPPITWAGLAAPLNAAAAPPAQTPGRPTLG